MAIWDNLPVAIALPLALLAALMSGGAAAPQSVKSLVADALKPQMADLGSDPGYLLGMPNDLVWPLPARTDPIQD